MSRVSVVYFGDKWDAPYLDDEPHRDVVRVDTPVGQPCYWCTEPVADTDRGLLTPVVSSDGNGGWTALIHPVHAECRTREVIGSPAHLAGRCRCHGRTEPAFDGTARQEALATLAIVNDQRRRAGLGPMW